jgi:hypothetical protein
MYVIYEYIIVIICVLEFSYHRRRHAAPRVLSGKAVTWLRLSRHFYVGTESSRRVVLYSYLGFGLVSEFFTVADFYSKFNQRFVQVLSA